MRDLTWAILMLCMFALLSTAVLVDSESTARLAWRLCGLALVGLWVGLWVGVSIPDAKKCRHPNLYEKWITEEGAPMIRQWCPDCHFLRYEEVKP